MASSLSETCRPSFEDRTTAYSNLFSSGVKRDPCRASTEALKGLRDTIGQTEGVKAFPLNVEGQL
jgi:hypothetical protein